MKNNYYQNREFGELKLSINDSFMCDEFYSQAGQDIFVISALNGKKEGIFLDIGASDPQIINNTFLLEKKFGWKGVQIEIDEKLANKCISERNTEVICQDATTVDYEKIFSDYKEIDYLSIDIDGIPSLKVLERLPLDKYKIKVITFEHDSYKEGDKIRTESRKIFDSFGYYRICSNVANENNIYEDWYINTDFVDINEIKILESESKNWNEILFK